MKVYSIGREPGCDILVNDSSNVVSRRHAVLNVTSTGKMTITDLSHNGTYVNGMRIAANVPVPVTRKDNISFAHVARLDWALVPNPLAYIKYVIAAVLAVILIAVGFICFKSCGNQSEPENATTLKVDSASIRSQEEKLKKQEQERKDSIRKAVEDSIKAANAAQPAKTSKKTASKNDAKPKDTKKCSTCGKDISACEHKGNHPAQEGNTKRKFR